MKHAVTAMMLAILSVACGQSNTFSGKVDNKSFEPKDAIYFTASDPNVPGVESAIVVLTSTGAACDDLSKPQLRKNMSVLALSISAVDPNAAASLKTGTYDMASNTQRLGFGVFQALDSACADTVATAKSAASLGTVTVKAYSKDASIEADFNLTFGTDATTGHFDAKYCAGANKVMTVMVPGATRPCVD